MLVNNAGVHDDVPLAGMRGEQWDRVIDVSLNGFYNVTQPLLLPMIRTRWGRIINISSVAGVIGNRGQVNYAAAKAGLHGATKSLALELATRGITVNAIAPGIIASPATEQVFPTESVETLVPMKRAGDTRRSSGAGRLPGLRPGRLHLRPGHFDQRGNGLKAGARVEGRGKE